MRACVPVRFVRLCAHVQASGYVYVCLCSMYNVRGEYEGCFLCVTRGGGELTLLLDEVTPWLTAASACCAQVTGNVGSCKCSRGCNSSALVLLHYPPTAHRQASYCPLVPREQLQLCCG